jgi:hypothetical protein
MSRRTDAALVLLLALACRCSGLRGTPGQAVDVGHHHVRLVPPNGWERLDHGRAQLFRRDEAQLALVDLGPVTADAMAREVERARGLWLAGRRLDAFERVRELRSPALRYASHEQRAGFWQPWTDVTWAPGAADSAAIGPAFDALIRGARALAAPTPDLLYQYVADLALDTRGQEIASRERRIVHGHAWVVYDLWDRVSHGGPTRVAFTADDGDLLALTMDRGPYEQLEPAFESLLASLDITTRSVPAP